MAMQPDVTGWGGVAVSLGPNMTKSRTGGYLQAQLQSNFITRVKNLPATVPLCTTDLTVLEHLDSKAIASMLKDFSRDGLVERALELFEFLRQLQPWHMWSNKCDAYLYTSALALLMRNPKANVSLALQLSKEMDTRGLQKNLHTYAALIAICVRSGDHGVEKAMTFYNKLQEEGLLRSAASNRVPAETLIEFYGKVGRVEEALQVLQDMQKQGLKPTTRTYNTLMIACNGGKKSQYVMRLFNELLQSGCQPNSTTYNALLTACSRDGRLDKVVHIYQQMLQQGCKCTVHTYSILLSACEKGGHWELALQLFQEMQNHGCKPNVVTYNSLLTACAQGAQWRKAEELFEGMHQLGITPDVVTYTALISAYDSGGQWLKALKTFDNMQQADCNPDTICYQSVLEVLVNTGLTAAIHRASQIYRQGARLGVLVPLTLPTHAEKPSELYGATAATIILSLFCWLADVRELVVSQGPAVLPTTVLACFCKGKGRDQETAMAKEAVMKVLQANGCNAHWVRMEGVSSASMAFDAESFCSWIQQESTAKLLEPFGELTPAEVVYDLAIEEDVSTRCAAAFSAVWHFENTHSLSIENMAGYLPERQGLVEIAFAVAEKLNVDEDAVHDAVLLLDRGASVAPDLLAAHKPLALMAACLFISIKQILPDVDQAEISSQLVEWGKLEGGAAELEELEGIVRSTLSHDTSSISAYRCLQLFYERLGYQIGATVVQKQEMDEALSLLREVVSRPEFLNCRPSILAAAVVRCERKKLGVLPLWPSVLYHMTTYAERHHPELTAATTGVQHLLFSLSHDKPGSGVSPIDFVAASPPAAAPRRVHVAPLAHQVRAPPPGSRGMPQQSAAPLGMQGYPGPQDYNKPANFSPDVLNQLYRLGTLQNAQNAQWAQALGHPVAAQAQAPLPTMQALASLGFGGAPPGLGGYGQPELPHQAMMPPHPGQFAGPGGYPGSAVVNPHAAALFGGADPAAFVQAGGLNPLGVMGGNNAAIAAAAGALGGAGVPPQHFGSAMSGPPGLDNQDLINMLQHLNLGNGMPAPSL